MTNPQQSKPHGLTPQPGLTYYPGALGHAAQAELLAAIDEVIAKAPLFTPRMPHTGWPMHVEITNCGRLGWVADIDSYRYQDKHPYTGLAWPEMPSQVQELWALYGDAEVPAEACLINYYKESSRLNLHQDKDETDFSLPVVSISLGDRCQFRFGSNRRDDATKTVQLASGDIVVLKDKSRLCYHGVDKILSGSSRLLQSSRFVSRGRFNLTLRRVSAR